MLKTYQFKTYCKGDSHSSKTASIILPGLAIKQRFERPYVYKRNGIQIRLHYVGWNNLSHQIWILYFAGIAI